VALVILNGFVIFSAAEIFWGTVVPGCTAVSNACCGWAARCHPVFAATACVSSVDSQLFLATTFSVGFFGDGQLADSPSRILGAQASILAVSFCVFVLVALFAETTSARDPRLVAKRHAALQEALTELAVCYTKTLRSGSRFSLPIAAIGKFNRHLTEICGISIADHIGKSSAKNTVPQVADQVRVDRPGRFLRTGEADHGHRGQWPTPGREQCGARVDYLLASAEG